MLDKDDLRLIIRDVIDVMPDTLNGAEVASVIASIAASYSCDSERRALFHLFNASIILQKGKHE